MAQSQKLLYFKRSGLGDDLMVFWAAVAAVIMKIIPEGICLYFEKPETREFLIELAALFPEIKMATCVRQRKDIAFIRHASWHFNAKPLAHIQSGILHSNIFCEPYHHKWLTEYGNDYKPGPWASMAIRVKMLQVWKGSYDTTYDGWQQLAIGLGISELQAKEYNACLSKAWTMISQRVARKGNDNGRTLFFPGGGSAQNLNPEFIAHVKQMFNDIEVVRFMEDPQEADVRFGSIKELAQRISRAKLVITSDSLPSHIAQFYAKKHILIATRSRPDNICFPNARNTRIIDFGKGLACRPCFYSFRDSCAAGHSCCIAQKNREGLAFLENAIEKFDRASV